MWHKEGYWIWILDKGKVIEWDESGNPLRMIGTHTDITQLKQAEEELRLFKTVVESSQEAIAISDPDGQLVYINPAHQELFGRSQEEAQGMDYRDYYPPESIEILNCDVAPALARGESWEGELDVFDAHGRRFPLWERADSIHDAEGNMLFGFGLMHDVTDLKQAEAEREKLQARLQQAQKAESLGRMAGAIAHHFNNQLSVVMGNLELVLDDLPDDSDNREILVQSFEAGRKAAEVSQQMLRYLGHISGSQTAITLSDVSRQSLALLQSAKPNDVTLNVDFPDSGPIVHADAGQIQQVLTNLFTNAQESLPDNQGIIGLTIQTVSHEDIPTSNRFPLDWHPQDNPYACLEISDTGHGISREDIEKLFDPFYTTKFTGRGMGLPVTMGILKTHNGCITVDSKPEIGTVFRVYLPLSTEKKTC